jgi:hypothetical protein
LKKKFRSEALRKKGNSEHDAQSLQLVVEMRIVCCCWVWQQKGFQQPLVFFPTLPLKRILKEKRFDTS